MNDTDQSNPGDDADAELTRRVLEYARELGADLAGVADAAVLNAALEEGYRPEDSLPGCRSVVVMALHIPDGALEIMRRGKSNYSYNLFGYTYLNRELDFLSYRMSRFLDREGYATVPIPGRGTAYWSKRKFFGPLSFRHCAVAAGLATFGINGLALSPEFGSRQRFIALPTTAPLDPAREFLDQSLCDNCMECLRNCPARALSLRDPMLCTIGDRTYRYAKVDGVKCTHMARGLSTEVWKGADFNPNTDIPFDPAAGPEQQYENLWSRRDARIRISEHAESTYGATLCGRCMAFCTAGHDAMNRRLRPAQTTYQNTEVLHPDGAVRVPDRFQRKLQPKEGTL